MSDEQSRIDAENERLFGGGGRRRKPRNKGMSDDEIITSGEGIESSNRVPKWFIAIIVVVVLIAFGLTIPFWGDRADAPREWFNWGQLLALGYMIVFGGFVYFMTSMYDYDQYEEDEADEDEDNKE
jgi:hypothetical protein